MASPEQRPNDAPRRGRRLVLCLDGTWNNTYQERKREDGSRAVKPSNVLKLCRGLPSRGEESGRAQIVYYDIGVGSLASYPGLPNRLLRWSDRLLGGAWGAGFEANVEDALGFLALNHEPGDEVFVFGFSRGAATARALTRFLDWSGGLPTKSDVFYLPHIFRAYILGLRSGRGAGSGREVVEEIDARRREAGAGPLAPFEPVDVAFLGVWDTVTALGSRFLAVGPKTSARKKGLHVGDRPARCVRHARQALAVDEVRFDFRPEVWTRHGPGQILRQRWFAGVHANVGGGYPDDGLANVAFQWLLDEAVAVGLEVDRTFTRKYRAFAQDRLYRSETLYYRVLDRIRLRLGRGRRRLTDWPPDANLRLHPSVIHRINADPERFPELRGTPYRPRNVLELLARQPDLDRFLRSLGLDRERHRRLPDDVLRRIEALRRRPSG